ncbi:MAG: hypothetical protein HYR88_18645 [Verrucomicrobia bacterium]|nr:hypothetical protein [Verrucomicrobiota bacterium]MBI3870790.1 hypothetical protein [Verrucomicrobiota bacterium]
MKKLLCLAPWVVVAAMNAQGQGYVLFSNVTQDLMVEKKISDAYSGDYLNSAYVAQLFAGVQGSIEGALNPLDVPVYFLDSPPESVGDFLGNELQIAGVNVGNAATLQVRVWSSAYATWSDAYSAALLDGNIHVGKSGLFDVTTGAQGSNVEIAINMPQFTITAVPEPSVLGLGALGLGLALIRRRL